MGVNNIDFTLGSYNPSQAAGLISMARDNDRQISDSLKGILDGFDKTARENADKQAMHYINSLGLADMTPDKMVGHTQALEQIANSMGGLNPSKEALTALDGRGNVLTQRAINDVSLATNQHNWNRAKEAYDFEVAIPLIAETRDTMDALNADIGSLNEALKNYTGDKNSKEYEAIQNHRNSLIHNYASTFEEFNKASQTLSPLYKNNLNHRIDLYKKNSEIESQTATNNLNTARDAESTRLAGLYSSGIYQSITSRFQTSIGENGQAVTIDTMTGKPVTGAEVNGVISSMLDNFGLVGDTRTMVMNKITDMQTDAATQKLKDELALKGLEVKKDVANIAAAANVTAAQIRADASIKLEETRNANKSSDGSDKVTLTNGNGRFNKKLQNLDIHTWVTEDGSVNVPQIKNDIVGFIKDNDDRMARGYFNSKKGEFVKGGVTNWYMSDEGARMLKSMEDNDYVAKGKASVAFNNYFKNAPKEILDLIPTDAHKVEFIKYLATTQHEDSTNPFIKFLLYPTRGVNGLKPLNLILGLDSNGEYATMGRPEGNDAVVKSAAIAASNAVKSLKQDSIRNHLNPRFKALADIASLNGGLHSIEDVIRTYGLGNIKELQELYDTGGSDSVKNPFKK